jgi:hypothetical protein
MPVNATFTKNEGYTHSEVNVYTRSNGRKTQLDQGNDGETDALQDGTRQRNVLYPVTADGDM